jgi:hypothetical protein
MEEVQGEAMGRGICWRAKGQKGGADVLTNKWPCDLLHRLWDPKTLPPVVVGF